MKFNFFYFIIEIVLITLTLTYLKLDKVFSQTLPISITPSLSAAVSDDKIKDLQNQIKEYEQKVNALQNQEKTFTSQIKIMDSQIVLTQLKMDQVKQQIVDLEKDIGIAKAKITDLEKNINVSMKSMIGRVNGVYKVAEMDPLGIFLSSSNISNFFTRLTYLRLVQIYDKKNIYAAQQAKVDYANQQNIYEDKQKEEEALKKTLETYTNQLSQEKRAKQQLLDVTKSDEKKYQDLLAKARSEYEAIQGIVAGKGDEVSAGHVDEGQKIASIIQGPSCNSGGSHLHFIVSQNGNTQNPFNYLKGGVDYGNCSGSNCGSSDGDSFNPSGNWNWPIDPQITLSQGYGVTWAVRYTYVGQIYNFHNGIDINSASPNVKAIKSGTLFKGSYSGVNGCRLRYVRVKHDDGGLDTLYLHVNYNF